MEIGILLLPEVLTELFTWQVKNIASGRWTRKLKRDEIRNSRIEGTKKLCEHILKLPTIPSVFVCASAIGYYGDRGMEFLNEGSPRGSGFLPEVCLGWEEAAESVSKAGIRVINVRFGVVLSKDGGALAKMLTPFNMCMGGKVGSGTQYMSWVAHGRCNRRNLSYVDYRLAERAGKCDSS